MSDVQDSLIGLARSLKMAGHQIQVIPVWPEDISPCVDLAKKAGLERCAVSPALTSHTRFLKAIEHVDIVVALKLHAGILSAAANVPFVLLAYQPKALDFAASLKWEQFTIRTDELTSSKLIEIVSLLIDELPTKKRELCTGMCRLVHLFEEYCRKIEPMLLGKSPMGLTDRKVPCEFDAA
jgi:polysaccharide pyruvyl transferase WcaK-like protein